MRLLFFALLVLASCDKKKQDAPSPTPGAAAPAPPPNAAPVEICGKLPRDQVEAIVGTLTGDPAATPARGSLLGQCTYMSGSVIGVVSARPVGEFDGTVNMIKEKKDVPGVGERAVFSNVGMLVKLPGKPFFIQVVAEKHAKGTAAGMDEALCTALAKIAAQAL